MDIQNSGMNWLHWDEFWFNSTYNESIQMAHFKALFGRDPPMIVKYQPESTRVQQADHMLIESDAILEELKVNLNRAQ